MADGQQKKSRRGLAAMTPEQRRAISSMGGKAAHAKGVAHKFTPEEAALAGQKGGRAAHAKGAAHEFTPEEARRAGRCWNTSRTTPGSSTARGTATSTSGRRGGRSRT
jgi:general stress protein YciG